MLWCLLAGHCHIRNYSSRPKGTRTHPYHRDTESRTANRGKPWLLSAVRRAHVLSNSQGFRLEAFCYFPQQHSSALPLRYSVPFCEVLPDSFWSKLDPTAHVAASAHFIALLILQFIINFYIYEFQLAMGSQGMGLSSLSLACTSCLIHRPTYPILFNSSINRHTVGTEDEGFASQCQELAPTILWLQWDSFPTHSPEKIQEKALLTELNSTSYRP